MTSKRKKVIDSKSVTVSSGSKQRAQAKEISNIEVEINKKLEKPAHCITPVTELQPRQMLRGATKVVWTV